FRTGLAALLLVPLAAHRRELGPLLARWRPLLAYTAIEVALPWVLLSHAETKLTSSLTGLLIAAVPLVGALIVSLSGERERLRWPSHMPSAHVVESVVGLAVVCSAAAFLIFFALIREVGPVRATVITYVNPAVAAVLGVALLSEHLTAGMLLGFALVLLGCVLATGRTPEPVPEP